MTKYGRTGSLLAKEGKGEELKKILLDAAAVVSEIKECHQYVIGEDTNNSDLIWVFEIWESKDDHGESLKSDKVLSLIGNARPLLHENQTKGAEMYIIGGLSP